MKKMAFWLENIKLFISWLKGLFTGASSISLQLLPTFDKTDQFILNVWTRRLRHLNLFQIQGPQDKYEIELFLFNLDILDQFFLLISVHFDLILVLLRFFHQGWNHWLEVLYSGLGLNDLWEQLWLAGFLLMNKLYQMFYFSHICVYLTF